jgi:uncharacterized protein YvpB
MQNLKLNVPYYSQLDNETQYFGNGGRQCNVTSHAMALAYLYPDFESRSQSNGFREPESYLSSKWVKHGDVTDHHAGTLTFLYDFNIKSSWQTNLSRRRVMDQLSNKKPVPLGVSYKASGHIVCCVGYNDEGLWIHDPYGIRQGSSDEYLIGANGSFDHYSWELCDRVIFDGGSDAGWGRVFF